MRFFEQKIKNMIEKLYFILFLLKKRGYFRLKILLLFKKISKKLVLGLKFHA